MKIRLVEREGKAMHAAVSRAVPLVCCHPRCSTRCASPGDAAPPTLMIVVLAFGWPTICGRLQHELGVQPTVLYGRGRSCGSHRSGSATGPRDVRGADPDVERLVGVFRHRCNARAIGAAYLAMRSEERIQIASSGSSRTSTRTPLVIVRRATRNSALGSGGVRRMILRPAVSSSSTAGCSLRRKAAFAP